MQMRAKAWCFRMDAKGKLLFYPWGMQETRIRAKTIILKYIF